MRVQHYRRIARPTNQSFPIDSKDPSWPWHNYLSQHALLEAEKVRDQLEMIMVRFDVDLATVATGPELHREACEALACGFFM